MTGAICQITSVPANTPDDALWDILSLSVGNPTPEKMHIIRAAYATEAGRGLLAAKTTSTWVGCLGYRSENGVLEIVNIAVLPSLQRRGIGRDLIEAASAKFPRSHLEAETDGEAVGFYKSVGFVAHACHRRPDYTNRWTCRKVAYFGGRVA